MNSSTMETYCGHVRTPADAIKLFEACRLGLLPRVQRRLSEKERQSIKSGSVFVWDEREAGMRRWTDGKSWSASRVSGSFLTYREMEGKRGGGNFVPAPTRQRVAGKTPDSGRGSDEDADMDGEGPDGYRYKPDGLMKQSFSITTSSGQHLHLISYYARHHANSHELVQPTSDPALRHIVPLKGMYPESTVQEQPQGPAVTRAPMQSAYMSTQQQMAPGPGPQGHLRGPYPYQVSQGYNWPPSPVSTPPYNYQGGSYGPQLQPQPPNPTHTNPRHNQQPPNQPANYDRLQPAYLDPSLPPPSHSHQRISGSGPQQPSYARTSSPQMAQARLIAEQQAQQAQRLALEQQHMHQMLQTPAIDPRITSLGAHPQSPNGHTHQQQAGPTSSPSNQELGNLAQSQSQGQASNSNQGQSQSQNIPSISSMVHNHTPTLAPADDVRSNASNGTSSRAGSASPKGGKGKSSTGGPQDIPHAKLGFAGEDVRALRVLDRKFCI